jgi:branched-subunit amino acid aminotransferase/4-amino-4-deoxychorismate lyase
MAERSVGRAAPPPGPAPARSGALWINGRIVRGDQAALSLFDRGARDGEGLFETVRVYAGRPRDWDLHMERLVLSAAELGFPVPPSPARLEEALDDLLRAEGLAEAVARVTVTRGVPGGHPTRTGAWIEAGPVASRLWRGTREGRARVILSKRPFHPGPMGCHKTTSRLAYALASEEARAAGADETLLASAEGEVLEGATSNLFVVARGTVLTPPLARGILPGIVRARVLAACGRLGIKCFETEISRRALEDADEVFLTNSVQEVVPVASVEDRPVPDTAFGSRLRDAYREGAGGT